MNNKDRVAVFGIALASASLGFLTGVLTAPRSGKKSRRLLARRLQDEKEELVRRGQRVASDAAEELGERFGDAKRAAGRAIGR